MRRLRLLPADLLLLLCGMWPEGAWTDLCVNSPGQNVCGLTIKQQHAGRPIMASFFEEQALPEITEVN